MIPACISGFIQDEDQIMQDLRALFAVGVAIAVPVLFTACDDDNGDQEENNTAAAPATFTTEALLGSDFQVMMDNGQVGTLTFPTAGRFAITFPDGIVETGQLGSLGREGDVVVATLVPASPQGRIQPGDFRLEVESFANDTFMGTVQFQEELGAARFPFIASAIPGTPVGTTAGTIGGTTAGTVGDPIADLNNLAGQRIEFMTLNAIGRPVTIDFGEQTFVSDLAPGVGGTFAFNRSGDFGTLRLDFDSPVAFESDFAELTVDFNTRTFSGTQRFGGIDSSATGTFEPVAVEPFL